MAGRKKAVKKKARVGRKANGQLKRGYRARKGGGVVKAKKKAKKKARKR